MEKNYKIEFDNKKKEHVCCFCGRPYKGYGNSTWGCWPREEEMSGMGERMRCCNDCNERVVIPVRIADILIRTSGPDE